MNIVCLAIVVLGGLSFYAEGKLEVIEGYNPGSCDQQSHGKEVLVKDRSDDDKILICVKENNAYLWTSVDGSNTLGEFINPAYDCSHVMNQDAQAKDGFYWINLKHLEPKKIWCDMTTDGGGFALIGRKTTPETWTLPSNNTPVHPYGPPHWLSSLGDAPILDFRVQIATSDNLKATKAHWYYRLKSRRPLKQLMQVSKDCGWSSAGIADIAYVKDLQTDSIVSHNFSCSKFGYGHVPATGFGWVSMNECLEKPCPWGYAKEDKHSQHDYAGAFSYSVVEKISGLERGATAFMGCDGRKCCGCFGPLGGKKNYCSQSCDTAINGGTVTDKVSGWFWVRSSLPKIVFEKCMEYKAKGNHGKLVWYKFVGGSAIPVKGRCNEKNVNFLDGIAVVPKEKTIPPVSGLLAYRKENKEIYVRSNGTWNALALKNKILQKNLEVNSELKDVKDMLHKQNETMISKFKEFEKNIATIMSFTQPQECNGYTLLDNQDRNINYTSVGSSMCDSGISTKWYRFGGAAGTQLPTSCVPRTDTSILKCGTHAVSWLNGTHPSLSEGKVTREVCFSWKGSCCPWKRNIEMLNCGLFYIYKLIPAPNCSLRYCGTNV